MSATATRLPRRLPTTFAGLNRMHPLRPIRDENEWDDAMVVVDRLAGRADRTADQTDYLASLTTLIRAYEAEHPSLDFDENWPVHERLNHLCELHGMTAADLGDLLGARSLGSKLLRGEREPSKAHIKTLSAHFKLRPAFFLD